MDPDIINTDVQGVRVTGEIVERSAAAIEVRLVAPFGDLKLADGRYIMAAAQPFVSFEGDHGDEVAQAILRMLYLLGSHVDLHRRELEEAWRATRQQLDARSEGRVTTRAALAERRQQLRTKLRAGQLTSDQYQRLLGAVSDELDEWLYAEDEALEAFWRRSGFQLSISLRDRVMTALDPGFEPLGEEDVE